MLKINIAGTLHNTEEIQDDTLHSHVVVESSEVLDVSKSAKQSDVNANVQNQLDQHQSLITALDSQNYVTVSATSSTTDVSDLITDPDVATIYRVGNWNGTQYDTTTYSEYAYDGTALVLLDAKQYGIAEATDFTTRTTAGDAKLATVGSILDGADDEPTPGSNNLVKSGGVKESFKNDGGAYDISVHFPTGGVNGGNTYTLSDALNIIQDNMRKGGMSIKFIDSASGGYVQYRYLNDYDVTDPNRVSRFKNVYNWGECVSKLDTNNCKNKINILFNYIEGVTEIEGDFVQRSAIKSDGSFGTTVNGFSLYRYAVTAGKTVFIGTRINAGSVTNSRSLAYAYDSNNTPVEEIMAASTNGCRFTEYLVPSGVDNICVYSTDNYGQYVAVVDNEGELDKIRAQISNLTQYIFTETVYDIDDLYEDNDNWKSYFTNLSGGVGSTLPDPNKYSISATYWGTLIKPVKKGQKVTIATKIANETTKAWAYAFTDMDKKILVVAGSDVRNTLDNPFEYTVTQDGYVVSNVSLNTESRFYVKIIENIKSTVGVLSEQVDSLDDQVDSLDDFVRDNDLVAAVATSSESGKFIKYDTGETRTSTATRIHTIYACTEGEIYSIKLLSLGNSAASVGFFDADGGYLKDCYVRAESEGVVQRIIVRVPVNAATMHTSSKNDPIYVKKALGNKENTTALALRVADGIALDAVTENPLDVLKETGGYTTVFHTLGVIGGSMASGAHELKNDSDNTTATPNIYEYSFIQRMAAITGNTAYNFSHGGMSARAWLTDSQYYGGQSQQFINNKAQGYIIQMGNNDLNYHYDHNDYLLGSLADVNIGHESDNPDTFYGNLSKIIGRVREIQPKAYIFLSTFLRDYYNQKYGYDIPVDFDYNVAIREVYNAYRTYADAHNNYHNDNPSTAEVFSETLHFSLIDYYTYGKSWRYFFGSGIHEGTKKGTHLTSTGYQYLAYEYCTYIDWLIKQDMDYFMDVPIVGTDYHFA